MKNGLAAAVSALIIHAVHAGVDLGDLGTDLGEVSGRYEYFLELHIVTVIAL